MTIKSLIPVLIFAVIAEFAVVAFAQEGNVPARGNRGGAGFGTALAAQMLLQGDKNGDQKLAREEFTALADAWFDLLDPDNAGKVIQDDFLRRFSDILPPAQGTGQRGGRGATAAVGSVGFFTVVDEDNDAAVTRVELKQAFERWFTAWDTDKSRLLDLAELVAGLNSALPRTNFGSSTGREAQTPIPGLPTPPPSPVLATEDAIKTLHVVDGFKVELTASEPMIEDPIALSFDEDGRMFVLEMRGFMLDIDRKGERNPSGRISLLEDTDGDGRFDKATVYVDQLVLPRAIAAVAGGVLYVSDYKLYLAQGTECDGQADVIELVDADYGRGNVEHAANGLMRAMDNWIYNGDSSSRYRFVKGVLIKQRTEFRGQWGMSQDNYGRLIYDVNNSQLLGDYTPPNYMSRNSHHQTSAGLNLFVATDQRVFSIRMNTAVNRGYVTNVLDSAGKAYVFASSCSPVVYRGDNFPAEFVGNAFVCDPAVNLIKRNLVFDQNLTLTSKFAYDHSEFLASTDERFRPVSAYNGPDGTLWVVDMYRGIAQYGQFMTRYLRRESLERGLDKGIHLGRIYRIVSTAKAPAKIPRLSTEKPAVLVERLSHPNGWIRDTAQRLLVERGDQSVASELVRVVLNGTNALGRIHALWTLEGLFASLPEKFAAPPVSSTNSVRLLNVDANFALEARSLPPEVLNACLKVMGDPNPKIQVAAIRVAESLTASNPSCQQALLQELARLKTGTSEETIFQAALSAGNLPKPEALPLLARIASQATEHLLIRDAVISGLQDWELQFLQLLLSDPKWAEQRPGRSAMLQALAGAIIKERQPAKIGVLLTLIASQSSAQAWRQRSLLDGLAPKAPVRSAQPISLSSAPEALVSLAKSTDARTRQQTERIKSLFAWPGHQSAATKSQPPARPLSSTEESVIAEGRNLFQQVCAGCHGLTGQGLKPMAPPLVNSEWVLGSDSRLIRIALHGVGGPIKVNGTAYQPPDILPEMPALAVLEDAQIASILSYVRRDWGHEAAPVSPARVAVIRNETLNRELPWNEDELLKIK